MLLALTLCSFEGEPVPSTSVELSPLCKPHPGQQLGLVFILTGSIWHIGSGLEGLSDLGSKQPCFPSFQPSTLALCCYLHAYLVTWDAAYWEKIGFRDLLEARERIIFNN